MDHLIGRDRGTHFRGVRAWTLGVLLLTAAACSGDTPAPSAPRLPAHISAAMKDARIGVGVPAHLRVAGVEHNRLTLLTARKLRGESHRFADRAVRCAAIRRVLEAESPRTMASVGLPGKEEFLRAVVAPVAQSLPGCESTAASTAALRSGTAEASSLEEGDSGISDAAMAALDQLEASLSSAIAIWQVNDAFGVAVQSAAELDSISAAAVYSAVAQGQASLVLWEPGGAGWQEVGTGNAMESVFGFGADARRTGAIAVAIAMVSADLGGCVATVRYLRRLTFLLQDPRMLAAGCATGSAVASLYAAYKIVTEHE